jgi:hypothetical protein
MARGCAVEVAVENADDPSRILQSAPKLGHGVRCFEVKGFRSHRDLKRWMVREGRNGLGGFVIDKINQMPYPIGAKIALIAA